MVAEELSQDEIDSLFGDSSSDEKPKEEVKEEVRKFFSLLNDSLEEVLKTAFSLEVVSKFTDLSYVKNEGLSFDDKIIAVIGLSSDNVSTDFYVTSDKEFASILSDLMLMGPGEPKDSLEPDDIDALKELFSQVLGNLSTAVKDSISIPLSIEVKDVKQEGVELPESLYKAIYDIALPNIRDGILEVYSDKDKMDELFKSEAEEADEVVEENESLSEDVPFKEVEESDNAISEQSVSGGLETPKNLDLIMDIDLEVKIRVGEKYMLIKDILDLKDGSIVELDKSIEEPMDILVNGKVVARGVVVVVGGKFGIKITHIETREERIKSLGG